MYKRQALGRDFFEDGNLGDWNTMIDTNVKGFLYVAKAVSQIMVERKQGHIINLGSVAGKQVYEKGNVYCATKYAVDALSPVSYTHLDVYKRQIYICTIKKGKIG